MHQQLSPDYRNLMLTLSFLQSNHCHGVAQSKLLRTSHCIMTLSPKLQQHTWRWLGCAGGMVAVPAAALHHLSSMGAHMLPPPSSSAMAQSLSHLTAGAALLQQVPHTADQLCCLLLPDNTRQLSFTPAKQAPIQ